jgi:Zn-dependent peptidase ImmA (M78 family)
MPERSGTAQYQDNTAAKLRKRYGLPYSGPLDPFALAKSLEIKVIEPGQIIGISERDLKTIQALGTDWSAASFSLPDNQVIVILNPYHTQERKNITLMEEICHFVLKHKPKVRVQLSGVQELHFQNYTRKDEAEAYAVAASFLVPFKDLKSLVKKQKNIEEIALHFKVSPELIEYRLKKTGLLSSYNIMQKAREFLESS